MSIGSFQHGPGFYQPGGTNGLPSEPWLLPISDQLPPAPLTQDALIASVRQSSRRLWMAANGLFAVIALIFAAQVATDLRNPVANPNTGQIADANPPTLAAEKASLSDGR